MRLEKNELLVLRAIIEQGGFNRAAEHLHVSQSAISQSLANLEAKLDMVLVQRGKKPKLTEGGKRLFDLACETLRAEDLALRDLDHIRQGRPSVLSLALNSTFNRYYAPTLLSQFVKQRPNSRLQVQELPSRSIIYAVLSGDNELGMGPFQKHMHAFDTIPLFEDTRYLVISPSHPLAKEVLSGDESASRQIPLIASYLDDPDQRPAMERIRDQFAPPWQISSLSLRLELIAQGMGVGYINGKTLREEPLCKDLKVIEGLPYASIERSVGLYYQKGRLLSEAAKTYIELCQQHWQGLKP